MRAKLGDFPQGRRRRERASKANRQFAGHFVHAIVLLLQREDLVRLVLSVLVAAWTSLLVSPYPILAAQLAVSQYGRVTATLPWAVAVEKGFFADEGVNIDEIISGAGGGTTLRNVLASDLPYGEVATSAALAARKSGIDVVIVNTASDHIGEISLVTNSKSDIRRVQDLQGKKAGFTNPKSTSELLLRLALKQAGVAGKVEAVATGGFGGGLTLLDSGGIDAAPAIDPVLTLDQDKYRVRFSLRRSDPAHDLASRDYDTKVCARAARYGAQARSYPPPRRRLYLRPSRRGDADLR